MALFHRNQNPFSFNQTLNYVFIASTDGLDPREKTSTDSIPTTFMDETNELQDEPEREIEESDDLDVYEREETDDAEQ